MSALAPAVARLPDAHLQALEWFAEHQGQTQQWPFPLLNGMTRLVTQAKGIFKPAESEYALSVRQTLVSPYNDQDPVYHADGSWTYLYHQEGNSEFDLQRLFTNRGLVACQRDGVPVGVLRQTKGKPGAEYFVLGVALVDEWHDGFFRLEGFSPAGTRQSAAVISEEAVEDAAEAADAVGKFEPEDAADARERVLASVVQRRGQPAFRKRLLEAYEGRCAITGCDAAEALEAAHIIPYRGEHTNHPTNGILLRTDIHTLFDLGLIEIEAETLTVILAPTLRDTTYSCLAGQRVWLPKDATLHPSKDAIRQRQSLWNEVQQTKGRS